MSSAIHQVEQNTRLLVDPGTYLNIGKTQALTGHTPHTLARRAEEGTLVARRVGIRSFAYQTTSVVAYRRRQNPTGFSLFDLLANAEGEHLTDQEVADELDRAPAGVWWTLTRRDHYPPDWPSWQSWYRGETDQAEATLTEQRPRWEQQTQELRARGLTRQTLWLATQPVGNFGEYRLARYRHLTASGGRVRVLPAWKLAHLEQQRMLPDLEATAGAVYVRHHTRVGSRAGAIRITNPTLTEATTAFLSWADQHHALPLKDFTRWQQRRAA